MMHVIRIVVDVVVLGAVGVDLFVGLFLLLTKNSENR